MYGNFVVIEGIDGCGKGTVVAGLKNIYEGLGRAKEVVFTREPGGTPFGEEMRELYLRSKELKLTEKSKALMMYMLRNEHIEKVILPNVLRGKLVISERFNLSTIVYQSFTTEDSSVVRLINRLDQEIVKSVVEPCLTIYLRIPAAVAKRRILARGNLDSLEEKYLDTIDQLVGYYDKLATVNKKIRIVDGTQSREKVLADVLAILNEVEDCGPYVDKRPLVIKETANAY